MAEGVNVRFAGELQRFVQERTGVGVRGFMRQPANTFVTS